MSVKTVHKESEDEEPYDYHILKVHTDNGKKYQIYRGRRLDVVSQDGTYNIVLIGSFQAKKLYFSEQRIDLIKKGNPPHERINQSALKAVLNAARNFAAEQFDGHKYAFGLHHESDKEGEPPHPHVHLCVLVRNQFGERLNPRKNDLFEWRVRFAEKLRDEGVLCAATKRVHRGRVQKAEKSILRAMRSRGKVPDRYRRQAEELIEAVRNSERPIHPFLKETMHTRGLILEEYGRIARELYRMGHKTEARIISRLSKEVASQPFETRAQEQYKAVRSRGITAGQLQSNLHRQIEDSDRFLDLAGKLTESGHKAEAETMRGLAMEAANRPITGDMAGGRSSTQSGHLQQPAREQSDDDLTR